MFFCFFCHFADLKLIFTDQMIHSIHITRHCYVHCIPLYWQLKEVLQLVYISFVLVSQTLCLGCCAFPIVIFPLVFVIVFSWSERQSHHIFDFMLFTYIDVFPIVIFYFSWTFFWSDVQFHVAVRLPCPGVLPRHLGHPGCHPLHPLLELLRDHVILLDLKSNFLFCQCDQDPGGW